jgi:hypothetical protein
VSRWLSSVKSGAVVPVAINAMNIYLRFHWGLGFRAVEGRDHACEKDTKIVGYLTR